MISQNYNHEKSRLREKNRLRVNNYEYSEAVNSYEFAQSINPKQIAEQVSWYMNVTAMINSYCIGGGIVHIDDDSQLEYSIFLNLFSRFEEKDVQQFLEGIFLYNIIRKPGYSNAKLLLRQIMPSSSKPCILSYKYLENSIELPSVESNKYPYPLINIDIQECHGFNNIQIIINPVVKQAMRSLLNHESLSYRKKIFQENLRKRIMQANTTQSSKSIFSFKLFDKVDSEDLGLFSEPIFEILRKDIRIDNNQVDIYKTQDFISERITKLRGEVTLINVLQESITEDFIITTIALGLLDFETLIYFPATYYLDNKSQADDAILNCYMAPLDDNEINHEYNKVNELYTKINWSNTRAKGDESVSNSIGHEIRHLADFVKKTCGFLEENNVDSLSANCLRVLRDAALNYIDLSASNVKKDGEDEILVNLVDVVANAKYIGFIRRFYYIQLSLMTKDINSLIKLINDRILIIIDCEQRLTIKSKNRIALEKSLISAINNAVYHVLPESTDFEEFIQADSIYKIFLSYRNNADSNICQINIYNPVSLISFSKSKKNITKNTGSLKVIKSQIKELGGNAFMELVESEKNLPTSDGEKIKSNLISLPVYLTCLQY